LKGCRTLHLIVYGHTTNLTAEIVKEIGGVIRKLGGDPDKANLTDT